MPTSRWLVAVAVFLVTTVPVEAGRLGARGALQGINKRLHGQLVDHTHNHGSDRRIWSPALRQWRDLYVYLPPDFDPGRCYPVILFLHGSVRDEHFFLNSLVEVIDCAIAAGKLPPVIFAAPDGSIPGRTTLIGGASFYLNSYAGNFEDYLLQDVWGFLQAHYPLRPEREAHGLMGSSMGGAAAFNLAIKHRDCFGLVVGFSPPVNVRWVNCCGRYWTPFDPDCWGWRTELRPKEVFGYFFGGLVRIPLGAFSDPVFGRGPDAIDLLSHNNPIEMLERLDVREGQLGMFIAYGGKDELNIKTQAESFLYVARQRGLTVEVAYDPQGQHNTAAVLKSFPAAVEWLCPQLAPFSPPRP